MNRVSRRICVAVVLVCATSAGLLRGATSPGMHGDALPSIEYRAQTGEIVISPDGRAGIDSFIIESASGFLDRGNPTFPGPLILSTNTHSEISGNFFSPQVGTNNFVLGPVARRFLSSAQLLPDLTLRGGISGSPNFNFDLIVNSGPLLQWNNPAGGSWGTASNWSSPSVPIGTVARFLGGITQPATVTLDANRGASMLIFDNPTASYTIALGGGGAGLALANSGRAVGVYVLSGAHAITAPVLFTEHTHFDIANSLTLTAPAAAPVARSFTKSGPGTLALPAGLDLPAPSSALIVNSGTVTAGSITGSGTLQVRGNSQVRIQAGGAPRSTSRLTDLVFDGFPNTVLGRLDLADNDLVVQATAAARVTMLDRVTNLVRFARNSGVSGHWSGNGLTSSAAAADPGAGTTLAVALNQDARGAPLFTVFNGIAVDTNSVLVKYTLAGDADLDGRVSLSDYFAIDRGRALRLGGYQNGDFDYNGVINASDYALIDRAFLRQTGPVSAALPSLPAGGISSVPEPVAGIVAACFVLVVARRRRTARRTPDSHGRRW